MKIYVAAKFEEKERVKHVYSLLKNVGYTITHEWIHNKSSRPYALDPSFTAQCASRDIDGVRQADVFILLSHQMPSIGASAELGAAIASFLAFKKPHIYVVGPHFDTNFCFYHPTVIQKDTIEDVLHTLDSLAHSKSQKGIEL
jgi:hypothetical protein